MSAQYMIKVDREIVGYVDFDFARDLDRKSLTRYVFNLCGTVIS